MCADVVVFIVAVSFLVLFAGNAENGEITSHIRTCEHANMRTSYHPNLFRSSDRLSRSNSYMRFHSNYRRVVIRKTDRISCVTHSLRFGARIWSLLDI